MIKFSSVSFIGLLIALILLSIAAPFSPSILHLTLFINIIAVLLFAMGVILIVALIVDRFKDAKKENHDDYKHY